MIFLGMLTGSLLIIASIYKLIVSREKYQRMEAFIILYFGLAIVLFTLFFVYVTEDIFNVPIVTHQMEKR